MNTYDLAHRFFHEPTKRGEYANVNTSFYYNERTGERYYYSYRTIIGEIKKDRKGNDILIISDDNYSLNTSKHLNDLRRACPFDHLYVPRVGSGFYYGDYCYLNGMYDFKRVLERIADMTEQDLRRRENRHYVTHNLKLFDAYVAVMSDMPAELKRKRKTKAIANVVAIVEQKNAELNARRERIANMPESERAERKRKREEADKRKLERFLSTGRTLEKIRDAYKVSYRYHPYGDPIKEQLRLYRKELVGARDDKGRYLSYVWVNVNGKTVDTSQKCHAPIEDVKRILALWKSHHNITGLKAGMYTIVERTEEYVKIGCHVIPTWNIEMLCNRLNVA